MRTRIYHAIANGIALLSVGVGLSLAISVPVALTVLGLMLWVDNYLESR